MKRARIFTLCSLAALLLASCGKNATDYTAFVGTWGVEKIDYYNIDYAGNPISATIKTYHFDPEDTGNGIHLVFRNDRTGEMRDSAVDTVWVDEDEYIVNPDTTLVTHFTYSYDDDDHILYMNMEYVRTFRMKISNLSTDSFTYENEYDQNYVERAYMKRVSDAPASKSGRRNAKRPHMPGSLLGDR